MSGQGSQAAQRYARALLGLASSSGKVASLREAFSRIGSALETSSELKEALLNPLVERESKIRVVAAVAGDEDDLFLSFLSLLAEKGRMGHLGAVAKAFRLLADQLEGVLEARVETAVPLSESERKELKTILERRFRKEIRMVERIHPDVLGGIRVVLEDEVLDYALSTQLRRLGQRLRTRDVREVGDAG